MAKAEAPALPMIPWPVDEEGQPMALITAGASEKIGMPNYSNVDLGPVSVMRFVKDTPETRVEGIRETVLECETVIGEERAEVLKVVKAAISNALDPNAP